jgi:diguanylate cyclase (GGDEF)-like protein
MRVQAAHSYADELTGLANRRGFFEQAQRVFAAIAERGGECTAVVIDLDRLGYVNETYGHHAGSELIREAAAALAALAREGDVVGRIGGDELALLRPAGTHPSEALRDQIATAVSLASRSDRPFGLAVSVGVAVVGADKIENLDVLLWQADQSMYEHKRAGGGRTGAPHVRRGRRR